MNGTHSTLRGAELDDAAEIARLTTALGYPATSAAMQRRLADLLTDERHHVVVADGVGGRLLGWAHVERRQSLEGDPRAELMGLVVDAAARQRGIGSALVAAIEAWVSEQGLAALTVRSNVVRAESHPFYETIGFTRDKTQHVYVRLLGRD